MSDFADVKSHYDEKLKSVHIKDLLADKQRSEQMLFKNEHFVLDLSREKLDSTLIEKFQTVFEKEIQPKIKSMQNGEAINTTEQRQVLHHLLREDFSKPLSYIAPSFPDVPACLNRIRDFSTDVRSGKVDAFGVPFQHVVSIGIGGSYLGVECVYEALRISPRYSANPENLSLHFLSNVDPACFATLARSIDLKRTLVVVVSKTFTTAETLQNFTLLADELKRLYPDKKAEEVVEAHFCAISSNVAKCREAGLSETRIFPLWDWVGGRFSVSSAVGGLPLSLALSFTAFDEFLAGMRWADASFFQAADLKQNPAALLGFLDHFHNVVQDFNTKAIIPYSHGLMRLPAHIQQVEMESNGKRFEVASGQLKSTDVGKFVFGEPGTNAQHSFFQLLHQGRVSPVEFIGFCNPQGERLIAGGKDCFAEFMANMFAQADALAIGSPSEDQARLFFGDRPSLVLLFRGSLDAFATGAILSLYENRTAVEGFLAGINSFDQFGVELGKKLALNIRVALRAKDGPEPKAFEGPVRPLIDYFNENAQL